MSYKDWEPELWEPELQDAKSITEYIDVIKRTPVLTESMRTQFIGELQELLKTFPTLTKKESGKVFNDIIKRAMKEGGKKE